MKTLTQAIYHQKLCKSCKLLLLHPDKYMLGMNGYFYHDQCYKYIYEVKAINCEICKSLFHEGDEVIWTNNYKEIHKHCAEYKRYTFVDLGLGEIIDACIER